MKFKTIIIIIIIITAIGAIFWHFQTSKKSPEYTTFKVTKGTLTQSIDATGKVESAESINLNFKTTGRIASILVKVGDKVTAGQTLATLESKALQSRIDDARAKLAQAQADYQKLLAGASAEEIKIAENTVSQKKQDLTAAKNNLTRLKSLRDTELLNLKEAAITTLKNEIIIAQGAMDEIDNTLNDQDAKDTLSIKNSGALVEAKNNQIIANDAVNQSKEKINLINSRSLDSEVLAALDNLKETLSLVATTLSNTLDVLAATITSSQLSEAELDALKSNIKTQQTKINTAQTNIQTAKSNWTNKISYYKDQVAAAEDAIKQAEKALQIAESELALKKTPPRQFEIDAAQAKINQAQASLNLAYANLADTIITAPIKGVITKKNYEKGEQTTLNTPVLEMIGESNLQIEVNIPESDIAKVKTGQKVEITLDAFGDDKKFAGTVTFIDPAETVVEGVVYYKTKIQINEPQTQIKPGMTANLTIYTNKKDGVLIIPLRAIKSKGGKKYVEVLENGTLTQRIITTGLQGNQGVEVTSGLKEGEEVVTLIKE